MENININMSAGLICSSLTILFSPLHATARCSLFKILKPCYSTILDPTKSEWADYVTLLCGFQREISLLKGLQCRKTLTAVKDTFIAKKRTQLHKQQCIHLTRVPLRHDKWAEKKIHGVIHRVGVTPARRHIGLLWFSARHSVVHTTA